MPADDQIRTALAKDPDAAALSAFLGPALMRDFETWVAEAKEPDLRALRTAAVVEMLAGRA